MQFCLNGFIRLFQVSSKFLLSTEIWTAVNNTKKLLLVLCLLIPGVSVHATVPNDRTDSHFQPNSKTHLVKTDFTKKILTNISFFKSSLRQVSFFKAFLIRVNFLRACLSQINFQSACLLNVNLAHTFLPDANFTNAFLSKVNFSYANLSDTEFAGAYLFKTNFTKTYLLDPNFKNALVFNIILENATLENSILVGAQCINIDFRDTQFIGKNEYDQETSFEDSIMRIDQVHYFQILNPAEKGIIVWDKTVAARILYAVINTADLNMEKEEIPSAIRSLIVDFVTYPKELQPADGLAGQRSDETL